MEFCCPLCEATSARQSPAPSPGEAGDSCQGCGLRLPAAPLPPPDEPLERCWLCGNDEFYVQKDFNRRLGLGIVLSSAVVIFLVMLRWGHLVGIYCLLGVALLDCVAYRFLENAAVCYLCQSVYRGFPLNPRHTGFYLGSDERYKRRRQDWLEHVVGAAPRAPGKCQGE